MTQETSHKLIFLGYRRDSNHTSLMNWTWISCVEKKQKNATSRLNRDKAILLLKLVRDPNEKLRVMSTIMIFTFFFFS